MPPVRGIDLDGATRCAHYRSALDVVAIRMKCCGEYYACRACHDALTDHPVELWPTERRDQQAILCGACSAEMTITEYFASPDQCPRCGIGFNPGCARHRHLYFE